MLTVLAIYATGVALCLLAGIALTGLLDPRGRWIDVGTIPLGMCVLMALLYPVGAVLPGSGAAPVVLAVVVTGLVAAVTLRRRGAATRAAIVSPWPIVGVLALGVLAGALLLAPTIDQGFATTIGATNNDGWGYATLVDWLKDHPLPRDVQPDLENPLTLVPWNTDRGGFGLGFEHLAAMVATLVGRDGFEVVNATAAVGLAAAVGAWASLAGAVRPRLEPWAACGAAVAVASPALVLPFAENYTTQFVSLCLWPFAVATFLQLAAAPGWRRLLVAGLASGAVVGVYPTVTPWLILPIATIALLAPDAPAWSHPRLGWAAGDGRRARLLRAIALVAALAASVMIVAPIQLVRGVSNLMFLDSAPINAVAGFFSSDAYAALFLGATSAFGLFSRAPLAWSVLAALGLVVAVVVFALAPRPPARGGRTLLLAIAAGTLVTTGAVVVRYRILDDLPYQVYKGLISGGAVLAGLVVIALLPAGRSWARGVGLAGLGCLAAVWIPVSGQTLEATADGATGFRAADVEMGRALGALPPGSTVLAEGAAADPRSFQFRMMAAYFAGAAGDVETEGLGTTGSYITPGGLPEWRPDRPWEYVITTGPQPIATDRDDVWANAVYRLEAAPPLDVTTYGTNWYPPEDDGSVFAWTSGRVDLVLSNRTGQPVPARLRMEVESHARPRSVMLSAPGAAVRRRIAVGAPVPVQLDVTLPPHSATPVRLAPRPGPSPAPQGDPRALSLRVSDVTVAAR